MKKEKKLFLKLISTACFLLLLSPFFTVNAQWKNPSDSWKTIGPPKGTLYIVGGSASIDNMKQFIKLAGGENENIVVITTAGDVTDEKNSGYVLLQKAGAKNLTILHTRDKAVANTEEFIKPLKAAKAVMITGGLQKYLAQAYVHTKTHQAFFDLLNRGGVIAGSSAGASIQGSLLYGGQGEPEGFNFMQKSSIGQHYVRRNRMGSVARMIKDKPDHIGFGIDEATAIIVRGNEVIGDGESKTAIYDPTRNDFATPNTQEYLYAGDKYDLISRKITFRTTTPPTDLWENAGKTLALPSAKWTNNITDKGKIIVFGSKELQDEQLLHFYQTASQAPVVLLSSGNSSQLANTEEIANKLRKLGAKKVSILHTINSDYANSKSFVKPITEAGAVLFCSGAKWQYINNYRNTLVHRELFKLLERSGTIAAAQTQAPVFTATLFGEPAWTRGLSLIKNSLLHLNTMNNRTTRTLSETLAKQPKLVALGINNDNTVTFEHGKMTVNKGSDVKLSYSDGATAKTVPSGNSEQF